MKKLLLSFSFLLAVVRLCSGVDTNTWAITGANCPGGLLSHRFIETLHFPPSFYSIVGLSSGPITNWGIWTNLHVLSTNGPEEVTLGAEYPSVCSEHGDYSVYPWHVALFRLWGDWYDSGSYNETNWVTMDNFGGAHWCKGFWDVIPYAYPPTHNASVTIANAAYYGPDHPELLQRMHDMHDAESPPLDPDHFAPVAGYADGQLTVEFLGGAFQHYFFYGSTNLVSWQLVSDQTSDAEGYVAISAYTTNYPHRFFKTVWTNAP